VPSLPLRKHLPINALAHLTLPLGEGLSQFPLILHTPPSGYKHPPAMFMRRAYNALRGRAKALLLQEWVTEYPTP